MRHAVAARPFLQDCTSRLMYRYLNTVCRFGSVLVGRMLVLYYRSRERVQRIMARVL